MKAILFFLALLSLPTACSASENDDVVDPVVVNKLTSEMDDVLVEIQATIGSAACSMAKQCGVLPIGHKPCGGPSSHMPYSTQDTDVTQLMALAQQHRNLNRELNRVTGAMSDCSIVIAPKVNCVEGACQLVQ